ncbi:MAG: hypothetical protein M1840_008774 [Geoglossum simile]|nr:MAG: hypothetical protein M1840_008774 [Geoglossum simile]
MSDPAMPDNWDEERQLELAVAMSLGQRPDTMSAASPGRPKVIDLCSDEEESSVSRPQSPKRRPKGRTAPGPNGRSVAGTPHVERKSYGMFGQRTGGRASEPPYSLPENDSLGKFSRDVLQTAHTRAPSFLHRMDRKAMEEERLARKRKAPVSPPPRRAVRTARQALSSDIEPSSSFDQHAPTTRDGAKLPLTHEIYAVQGAPTLEGLGVQYPRGVIKKTWVRGCQRAGDVKLEEVLQKDDLRTAVLSAFQWDMDWVLSKIDADKTKLFLVMQAKDGETKERYLQDSAHISSLRLCFPPMPGNVNCMHSKLQLLFHPSHLRVAVPSANLTPYDWGEDGRMENMVFMVDLPRLPRGRVADVEDLTFFGKELVYFLKAMVMDDAVIKGLLNFDFTGTSELAFVHTIGGSHGGGDWKRTGYCGLGTAIQRLGLQTRDSLCMDIVTSSLGCLDERFLMTMYLAAQGDDGLKEYNMRNNSSSKKRRKTQEETESENSDDMLNSLSGFIQSGVRIYFPTKDTVANSKGGVRGGGTICFQSKWFHASSFPRQLLRDCRSTRAGLLMHNKMLFVRPRYSKQSEVGAQGGSWAYHGSANLTESAWGRLVKDRTSKDPKLNCRNWECGVIIPIPGPSTVGQMVNAEDIGVFEGHVPVPMQVPGDPTSPTSCFGTIIKLGAVHDDTRIELLDDRPMWEMLRIGPTEMIIDGLGVFGRAMVLSGIIAQVAVAIASAPPHVLPIAD